MNKLRLVRRPKKSRGNPMSTLSSFSVAGLLIQAKQQLLRLASAGVLTCFSFILLTACQPVNTEQKTTPSNELNKQANETSSEASDTETKKVSPELASETLSSKKTEEKPNTESKQGAGNNEKHVNEKQAGEKGGEKGAGQLDAALLAENSDSEALSKAEDLAINLDELDAELSALTASSDSNKMQNDAGSNQTSDSPDVPAADPNQALQGAQITKVAYQDANKQTIKTTFRTSAEGKLTADVVLANGRKLTLHAPEGQGNNPTYRSSDGTVELVSHSGGSSIDLLIDGKATQYSAVSAEAEVVTEM